MFVWIETLLAVSPPATQTELERLLGHLDVDVNGTEGTLGWVSRGRESDPRRGRLRTGVSSLTARFRADPHHMRWADPPIEHCTIHVELPFTELEPMLARRLGPGRRFVDETYGFAQTEYRHVDGNRREWWFYAAAIGSSTDRSWVTWARERPERAIPKAATGATDDFLATLVDRLVCDRDAASLQAALTPLAAAINAEVTLGPLHDVACRFRPGLRLADVIAALRWEQAIASSGDMHLSTWSVLPLASHDRREWGGARFGSWLVRVVLEGWPRGPEKAKLPELPRQGMSPRYDVRDCETRVSRIELTRAPASE